MAQVRCPYCADFGEPWAKGNGIVQCRSCGEMFDGDSAWPSPTKGVAMPQTDHLTRAKEYIAKGEGYYRKAADEIAAAMTENPALGYREVGEQIGRSASWAKRLVTWSTSVADPQHGPFGGPDENQARYDRQAKTVLRDPERLERAIEQMPEAAVENLARAVESRVPPERRSFTTELKPAREPKPAVDKIAQAVFTLWDASEMLLDEAPGDEERYRLLRLITKAERVVAGLRELVDTGSFDDDLRALVDEVRAES